jgi:DNA-binding transcriptional ArsR family regulator
MLPHPALASPAADPTGVEWGLPALEARASEAAALLKALAHPDRLLLLCQLVSAERTVSELGALAGVSQPSLSQQLGVLRGERLVATRREGKTMVYRIASPAAHAVLQTLYEQFCAPGTGAVGTSESLGKSTEKDTE